MQLPEFAVATESVEQTYVPGTSAEKMYENQKKYNVGLSQLKDTQSQQLDEIHSLKTRLAGEAAALQGETESRDASGMHLIDSPMQSAIYTIQEMIGEQTQSGEDQEVVDALYTVLETLTASNAYMPAFDFTKAKEDLDARTKTWLRTNFAGEDAEGGGSSADAGAAESESDAPLVGSTAGVLVEGLDGDDVVGLDTLAFNCWALPMEKYEKVVLHMYKGTGLLERFGVSDDLARRFITEAHKGYRNNPYHNWRHAFDVTQMAYCLTRQTSLGKALKGLELYALMLTALCHDIDHGGKTNDFLVDTDSPIALLYNFKSVNENHHCTHTFTMLSKDEFNMLGALSIEDKRAVRKMMIACFKATDMQIHFEMMGEFGSKIKEEGGFVVEDEKDTQMVLNVMMHAADLSCVSAPPLVLSSERSTVPMWQEPGAAVRHGSAVGQRDQRGVVAAGRHGGAARAADWWHEQAA